MEFPLIFNQFITNQIIYDKSVLFIVYILCLDILDPARALKWFLCLRQR